MTTWSGCACRNGAGSQLVPRKSASTGWALASHSASYRRFGAITNAYARERGTATIIALVRRQWRTELAAWESATGLNLSIKLK